MKLHPSLLVAAVLAGVGLVPPQDGQPAAGRAAARPAAAPAAGRTATAAPTIADLAFLAGTWRGGDGESTWESVYSSPDGGQVVSASKELRGGRAVMIDFEHFYEREGQLRLTPFPFGKRSVEFTLTALDAAAHRAVFENPEHDFPKRFTYALAAPDRLQIELVGDMGSGETTMLLELTRQQR